MKQKERCPSCGKVLPTSSSLCPSCLHHPEEWGSNELADAVSNELLRLKRKKDGALSSIVVGLILLIIASILLAMSWRYNTMHEKVFRPNSLEFVSCCICASLGLLGETYGAITLILSQKGKAKVKTLLSK